MTFIRDLIDRQNRRETMPPEPGDFTTDELMTKTPAQVAAYFVPDIVIDSAGCTRRVFMSRQPHRQVVLAEILDRLLDRAKDGKKK